MKTFEEWWLKFEPQIDPSIYENEKEVRKAIGRCAWGAVLDAKALDALDKSIPPKSQYDHEPGKVKPLAQYLFEHDCEYADIRSSYEYFQQALDAYQETKNVVIKIIERK